MLWPAEICPVFFLKTISKAKGYQLLSWHSFGMYLAFCFKILSKAKILFLWLSSGICLAFSFKIILKTTQIFFGFLLEYAVAGQNMLRCFFLDQPTPSDFWNTQRRLCLEIGKTLAYKWFPIFKFKYFLAFVKSFEFCIWK